MKKLYSLLLLTAIGVTSNAQVVISQVYGGGGNAGAQYTHDFIELYNRGTVAQDLAGWSVQYASSTGTSWAVTNLTGTIQPGKYYLVQQATGGAVGVALPTPDATGASNMSGTNGKVVLANVITAQTGTNPSGTEIMDKVGYGTANGFEGTAPAGALSNTTAAFRALSGCQDTNDNAADFVALAPSPKNSASPTGTCAALNTNQNSIAGLRVYPNPVSNGKLFIETSANAERTVTVYDLLGKRVLNTVTSNSEINVASLNSGVYVVKISEEGNTTSRKLVIR
jgi:predicted extracellular nuclease